MLQTTRNIQRPFEVKRTYNDNIENNKNEATRSEPPTYGIRQWTIDPKLQKVQFYPTQTTTSQLTYLNSPKNISQNFKIQQPETIIGWCYPSILCRQRQNQLIHLNSIIQIRDISYHKSSTNSKGPETGNQIQGIEIWKHYNEHTSSTRNIPSKQHGVVSTTSKQ